MTADVPYIQNAGLASMTRVIAHEIYRLPLVSVLLSRWSPPALCCLLVELDIAIHRQHCGANFYQDHVIVCEEELWVFTHHNGELTWIRKPG